MFAYCPHCGYIFKRSTEDHCPVCHYEIKDVPTDYLSPNRSFFASQAARNSFIAEVIETSPQYDQMLANRKVEILAEKQEKHQAAVAQKVKDYKNTKPSLRCPVCGSSNLSTISNLGKVVKISLIGVWGAGDLGKKRRCETCGHKF